MPRFKSSNRSENQIIYDDLVNIYNKIKNRKNIDSYTKRVLLEQLYSTIDFVTRSFDGLITDFNFSSSKKWSVTYRDEDGKSTDYFDSEKEAQEFIDHCEDRASKHAAEGEKFELIEGPVQIEKFGSNPFAGSAFPKNRTAVLTLFYYEKTNNITTRVYSKEESDHISDSRHYCTGVFPFKFIKLFDTKAKANKAKKFIDKYLKDNINNIKSELSKLEGNKLDIYLNDLSDKFRDMIEESEVNVNFSERIATAFAAKYPGSGREIKFFKITWEDKDGKHEDVQDASSADEIRNDLESYIPMKTTDKDSITIRRWDPTKNKPWSK